MRIGMVSAALMAGAGIVSAPACGPIETRNTVVIEQPKPLEVNVNLTGRLELVITDARKDLETITGEKAKRQVRPEDIGLPPTDAAGAIVPTPEFTSVATLADFSLPTHQRFAAASEDGLVASMAARNSKVRDLLTAKVAGEAHTGLIAERGQLSADQAATLAAENADRTELYKLRAAKNGTTPAQAALAYYLQRLGYAQKGDWVETYNKTTKQWEWTQWSS